MESGRKNIRKEYHLNFENNGPILCEVLNLLQT